jgi:DNA-binding NarL/FixJ family response regulator
MESAARALIVDDHPIVRDALISSLITLSVFEEVSTCSSFHESLDELERDANYQLLILDLSLTDIAGADGMIYIREHYPDVPIIVFSASDSADVIAQCFEHGVHGFVSKNSSMQVLVHAIQIVLAGSVYIPAAAASLMGFEPSASKSSDSFLIAKEVKFTPKQQLVFEQLMQGVPNKIISRRLDLAEGTVKAHLHSIYQTLGVSNRVQAILKAQRLNLSV